MKHETSIFIFHRDLRLEDNTGLNNCIKNFKKTIPIFIFDPRQLDDNPYKGDNSVYFMINSLKEINSKLTELGSKLHIFYGHPVEVLERIFLTTKISAVYENRDYTPFAIKRQQEISEICKKFNVKHILSNDVLANEPEEITNKQGTFFKVYTHFYNHCKEIPFNKPNYLKIPADSFISNRIIEDLSEKFLDEIVSKLKISPRLIDTGGRKNALKILNNLQRLQNYDKDRDFPALECTTKLSPHIKFGTISIREFYWAIVTSLGNEHGLIRQIYWRDFFYHIAFHNPHVFGNSFLPEFNNIPWEDNEEYFNAWKNAKTGIPIVDAGMRELSETGFMHNRVRMICASFLIKDLFVDWRHGEKHFAKLLLDYDPCVNNGNWQWCASTGCDAQPFFRIFNPWRQAEKFDPECTYIKKWCPELKNLHPKIIHNWDKHHKDYPNIYPEPIINHHERSRLVKDVYLKLRGKPFL